MKTLRVELTEYEWELIEDLLKYALVQKGNSKARNDTPYMDKIVDASAKIIFQIKKEKNRGRN